MIHKKDFSIVLADDHPLLLKGLNEQFRIFGYNVIGKASNGMQALELILTHNPKVAFLDIDMPLLTGFEVIKMAKEKNVDTKFIILSFHKESKFISQAKALQLDGYLLKEDSFEEIERCMEAVLNGDNYFSRSFDNTSLKLASNELDKLKHLTSSEKKILKQIAHQKTSNEIAKDLFISPRTVEKHRSNIINKLDLSTSTNTLITWALAYKDLIKEL